MISQQVYLTVQGVHVLGVQDLSCWAARWHPACQQARTVHMPSPWNIQEGPSRRDFLILLFEKYMNVLSAGEQIWSACITKWNFAPVGAREW